MDITKLPPGYKYVRSGRHHAVYFENKANMLFSAVDADGLCVEWFCSDNAAHLGGTTAKAMADAAPFAVADFGMLLIANLAKRLNATRLVISNARTPLVKSAAHYGTFA